MPNGAVFEAMLEDVSRADAPALVIAGTRLDSPGNPPIKFSIPYDPARIVADNQYVVRARITQNGKLLFTSDTATPVITRGNPMSVSIMLQRAGSQAVSPAQAPAQASGAAISLAGTSWQLVKFQGSDDKTLTPDDGAKYTIEFDAGGRLNARIDCNRGRGTWKSSGPNQLQFGPLALTRAMCPAGPARSDRQAVGEHPVVRDQGRPSVSLADGRRRDLRVRTDQVGQTRHRAVDRGPTRLESHHFIVVVTRSAASCWTKWPASGAVTSVRSFATQFHVPESPSECSAVSRRP